MDEVLFFNHVVLPKCFIAGMLSIALSFLMYLKEFESLSQAFLYLSLCILILSLLCFKLVRHWTEKEVSDDT
jgi:hypothetical protein